MQRSLVFAESSPAQNLTVASSVAVVGSSGPAGVAMLSPDSLETYDSLVVVANLVGAAGGTLDVYIQTSPDGGTTWADYAHFPQLAAGAAAVRYQFYASKISNLLVPAVIGINLTPTLAANTVVGGAWGDRLRLVMKTGAGASAGAAVSVLVAAIK